MSIAFVLNKHGPKAQGVEGLRKLSNIATRTDYETLVWFRTYIETKAIFKISSLAVIQCGHGMGCEVMLTLSAQRSAVAMA
jgi:hypothetical protein